MMATIIASKTIPEVANEKCCVHVSSALRNSTASSLAIIRTPPESLTRALLLAVSHHCQVLTTLYTAPKALHSRNKAFNQPSHRPYHYKHFMPLLLYIQCDIKGWVM